MVKLILIPAEAEHRLLLEQCAPTAVFSYADVKSVTPLQARNAHIILGNLPISLLGEAKKLEWLQLQSAGADSCLKSGMLPKGVVLTIGCASWKMHHPQCLRWLQPTGNTGAHTGCMRGQPIGIYRNEPLIKRMAVAQDNKTAIYGKNAMIGAPTAISSGRRCLLESLRHGMMQVSMLFPTISSENRC